MRNAIREELIEYALEKKRGKSSLQSFDSLRD
jgi:hypothetical protein